MSTILAVDPGLARTGYALLRVNQSIETLLDCGCLETSQGRRISERLLQIYNKISDLINRYQPDIIVIEQLFFNRNVKTAIAVGQAQGIVLLAAGQVNLESVWYTPGEVKQAVCGYGAASKKQVQIMVKKILNLEDIPEPDDVADALALAICHSSSAKFSSSVCKHG